MSRVAPWLVGTAWLALACLKIKAMQEGEAQSSLAILSLGVELTVGVAVLVRPLQKYGVYASMLWSVLLFAVNLLPYESLGLLIGSQCGCIGSYKAGASFRQVVAAFLFLASCACVANGGELKSTQDE